MSNGGEKGSCPPRNRANPHRQGVSQETCGMTFKHFPTCAHVHLKAREVNTGCFPQCISNLLLETRSLTNPELTGFY